MPLWTSGCDITSCVNVNISFTLPYLGKSDHRLGSVNLEKTHSEIPPFDPNGPIWELHSTLGKGTAVPQISDTAALKKSWQSPCISYGTVMQKLWDYKRFISI